MVAVINGTRCVGCGYCVDICPVAGITLDETMIATVDEDACIGCGICEYECPALAIEMGESPSFAVSSARLR